MIPKTILDSLSKALIKYMTSASPAQGADCALHASLAFQVLTNRGFEVRIAAGEAGWRIGDGDSDVIVHSPRVSGAQFGPDGKPAGAFHVWLVCESTIIDFTTYSLPLKAEQLDAMDGGNTQCVWAPPYLAVEQNASSTIEGITYALNAGVFAYGEAPNLYNLMLHRKFVSPADQQDVMMIEYLMANADIKVVGPNNVESMFE